VLTGFLAVNLYPVLPCVACSARLLAEEEVSRLSYSTPCLSSTPTLL
jgi:hypothetical protein